MTDELTANDVALKEEYFHLNQVVEDFDQRALSIKGWSVTVSMAGIAAAFAGKFSYDVILLAGIASLLFWFIEGLWKGFQQAFYPRLKEIEQHFRSGGSIPCLQINESWDAAYETEKKPRRVLQVMFWPHVALPHAVIGLGAPLLWLLNLLFHFLPAAVAAQP